MNADKSAERLAKISVVAGSNKVNVAVDVWDVLRERLLCTTSHSNSVLLLFSRGAVTLREAHYRLLLLRRGEDKGYFT